MRSFANECVYERNGAFYINDFVVLIWQKNLSAWWLPFVCVFVNIEEYCWKTRDSFLFGGN